MTTEALQIVANHQTLRTSKKVTMHWKNARKNLNGRYKLVHPYPLSKTDWSYAHVGEIRINRVVHEWFYDPNFEKVVWEYCFWFVRALIRSCARYTFYASCNC